MLGNGCFWPFFEFSWRSFQWLLLFLIVGVEENLVCTTNPKKESVFMKSIFKVGMTAMFALTASAFAQTQDFCSTTTHSGTAK